MRGSFNKNSRNCLVKAKHIKYFSDKFKIDNDEEVKLGDKVSLELIYEEESYKTYMKVNSFSGIETECLVNEFEWLDSHIFLLPFVGLNKEELAVENYLCSPYLYYKDENKDFDFLYLLYRFYPFKFYQDFIDKIKKYSNFVDVKNYLKDKRFDIITLKTDEKYREDLSNRFRLIFYGLGRFGEKTGD